MSVLSQCCLLCDPLFSSYLNFSLFIWFCVLSWSSSYHKDKEHRRRTEIVEESVLYYSCMWLVAFNLDLLRVVSIGIKKENHLTPKIRTQVLTRTTGCVDFISQTKQHRCGCSDSLALQKVLTSCSLRFYIILTCKSDLQS